MSDPTKRFRFEAHVEFDGTTIDISAPNYLTAEELHRVLTHIDNMTRGRTFLVDISPDLSAVSGLIPSQEEMPAIKGDSCDNGLSGTANRSNDQPSLTTHPNQRKGQL